MNVGLEWRQVFATVIMFATGTTEEGLEWEILQRSAFLGVVETLAAARVHAGWTYAVPVMDFVGEAQLVAIVRC